MARVFLSYARADGQALVDRLAADLSAAGHEPWLDRAEIQGGVSWSRDLEAAIDGCDLLVAIITRGAFVSSICRGEQARALRRGKRVVPVLGQAGADRPIYLETAHYLDFTEPAQHASRLAELLQAIDGHGGIGWDDLPPRLHQRLADEQPVSAAVPGAGTPAADWAALRAASELQRQRFLDAMSARRAGMPGLYEPTLYVARPAAELELGRFLEGEAPALLLVGPSGVGKTNLLAHWGAARAAAGDAVLMVHGERMSGADPLAELARDLELAPGSSAATALAKADALAAGAGRFLVLVFDGVNDCRGRGREGPAELFEALDDLAARGRLSRLKLVASCSAATWNRLDRAGALRLSWNRYHRTLEDREQLLLGAFDAAEARAAYERYREHFKLPHAYDGLPPALQARLREPLLLRLLALTVGGQADPGEPPLLDAQVFERYYTERVRQREDRQFLEALVGEMQQQQRASLPLRSLERHPVLGPLVRDDDAEGPYGRLLDEGVLSELPGDLYQDDLVAFTYPLVGAYALARRCLADARPLGTTVRELVAQAGKLPIAWDAAVAMLAVRSDEAVYAELAGAADPELRDLATESLVRLEGQDAPRARLLLDALLASDSAECHRTALRAAFGIGPDTRELLVRAAMSESDALRRAVRDTLYLIWSGVWRAASEPQAQGAYFLWRRAPDFTYGLLRELIERVGWTRPRQAYRTLHFALDLLIRIYVNHCDRPEVTERTADLFHLLTVQRLHLDRLALPTRVEGLLIRVVDTVFSHPLLRWMTLAELGSPEDFFRRPAAEREPLARLAPLLDPRADAAAAEPLLRSLLGSPLDVLRGAATLVLAVHATHGESAGLALHRRLWDSLDGAGRLWLLVGFAVLLPRTPPAWIPLLEELTARWLDEHRADFLGRAGLQQAFDIALVPLALAYGKAGASMPLLAQRLAGALAPAGGDAALAARLVEALGPAGFYQPQAVLSLLRPHAAALAAQPATRQALVQALATLRTLHLDAVDAFLADAGDDGLRRPVAAATDFALVDRFVSLLGYYNNAVHFCGPYPRMRRALAAAALELLAASPGPAAFSAAYTQGAIALARRHQFRLLAWTEPD